MKTRKVVYRGHLARVSHPLNATKFVEASAEEEIEVPEDMILSPHWVDVEKKTKASSKEGEDQ